jgi:hypothetical protein
MPEPFGVLVLTFTESWQMADNQHSDLCLFLELFGGLDESPCEFTDVPDLIIRYNGKVVGIEHTRLYRETPTIPAGRQLRPQEKMHWRLVERANAIFQQRSNQRLWLYVTFKEPFNYRQDDIDHEATLLAQSVLAALSRSPAADTGESVVRMQSWKAQQLGLPFPAGVDAYGFTVVRKPGLELWAPTYGGAVPTLTAQQLEVVIRGKETRLGRYRSRCATVWLLVVTNAGLPSSHFDITEALEHHVFTSAFDRVFLLTPFQRWLIELQTQRVP